jgi:hypothetical protein
VRLRFRHGFRLGYRFVVASLASLGSISVSISTTLSTLSIWFRLGLRFGLREECRLRVLGLSPVRFRLGIMRFRLGIMRFRLWFRLVIASLATLAISVVSIIIVSVSLGSLTRLAVVISMRFRLRFRHRLWIRIRPVRLWWSGVIDKLPMARFFWFRHRLRFIVVASLASFTRFAVISITTLRSVSITTLRSLTTFAIRFRFRLWFRLLRLEKYRVNDVDYTITCNNVSNYDIGIINHDAIFGYMHFNCISIESLNRSIRKISTKHRARHNMIQKNIC